MSVPSIQYLLEQIDQRHTELKNDNTEIQTRLTLVERFKWHLTGGMAILMVLLELVFSKWFEK